MSFADRLIDRAMQRRPDFTIGGEANPYLHRWWLIPRNPIANAYLHYFMRSDDDRALHDHPWANVSVLLRGGYREHLDDGAHERKAGDIVVRPYGRIRHRIELTDGPCWTLFLTGPRYRQWGFACERGWVHWKQFTSPANSGEVGRGCE